MLFGGSGKDRPKSIKTDQYDMTANKKHLTSEKKAIKESQDVALRHQLKIAKSTLKMSDIGADLAGGMTKRDAVKLVVKHHGIEHAKKLLKQSGHKDDEMIKLLENMERKQRSVAGTWFSPQPVICHSAFDQGLKVADKVKSDSKLDALKTSALARHVHHAKTALQHQQKLKTMLKNGEGTTPAYTHYDAEATRHKQLSDKFHAFAQGIHKRQKSKIPVES